MYLMHIPKCVPFPIVRAIVMKNFGAGAYIAVTMRGFWADLGVVLLEGHAIHFFPVREVHFSCIILAQTP